MKYANMLQKQFKKYFFISETCVSLLYQTTHMKALPNNNKPATHWSDGFNSIMKLARYNPYIFFLCIVGALGELFWVSLLIWLLTSML